MSKIERQSIANALNEREAKRPCHRCGCPDFSVIDGVSNTTIQEDVGGELILGGVTVPAAMVVCINCGAMTFHALGALGLLPGKEKKRGAQNG